jgi:hypothetical protein
VRVNIGNTSGGERRYLVCEVLGIRDKATEYQVGPPVHAEPARDWPRSPSGTAIELVGP